MTGKLVGGDTDSVVGAVLEWGVARLDLVNPTGETVETLVTEATARETLPDLRVLATEDVLKDVLDDFLVASRTADLVEQGHLELRTAADLPRGPLVVADDRVVALVDLPDATDGVVSDETDLVERTREAFEDYWSGAQQYRLRTPGLTRLRETLAEAVGEEVERDFTETLEAVDGDDGLDEVTLSLLVAAKHRKLLYDISKWGEDVGLASKATFSRTKSRLETRGLIDTEKVPIDVGRPRLRLTLADDDLSEASPGDLTTAARQSLSG